MNIESPTSSSALPTARKFNRIQKKKCSPLFSSSSLSHSSTSVKNGGNQKLKMALLHQINNQHTLNDLPINFDNAYDYIEESNDDFLLPCTDELDNNNLYKVNSNSFCMEEENQLNNFKSNNKNQMINSNSTMYMSGSTNSNASYLKYNFHNSNNDSVSMMTSGTCMTSLKSAKKLHLFTDFSQKKQNNFFMYEEQEDFVELENKINDWLDAEGIKQVEPNSRKMSNSSSVSIDNPFSSSSLIQRRKLRNLSNLIHK